MKYIILAIVFVQSSLAVYVRPPVRSSQWREAVAIMDKMLDENVNDKGVKFLIPGVIKLVFNDCIGGCNGCVNINQKGNEGLANTIETLEKYYNDTFIQKYFSRADFWTLTSVRALHKGITNNNEYCKNNPDVKDCEMPELPGIGWKSGRFDCNESPYYSGFDKLPETKMDNTGLNAWFSKYYNLPLVNTVSLMPFYVLAKASTQEEAESFEKLVPDGINMRTFQNLYNKCVGWIQMPSSNASDFHYQWVGFNGDVAHNIEMAPFLNFKIDLETNPKGKANCKYKNCGISPGSAAWVMRWMNNPGAWRNHLKWSWIHIMENGYRFNGETISS